MPQSSESSLTRLDAQGSIAREDVNLDAPPMLAPPTPHDPTALQAVPSTLIAPQYMSVRSVNLSKVGGNVFSGDSVSYASLNTWFDFEGVYGNMDDLLDKTRGSRQYIVLSPQLAEVVHRFQYFTLEHLKSIIRLHHLPWKRSIISRAALTSIIVGAIVTKPAHFLFGARSKMRNSLKRPAPLPQPSTRRVDELGSDVRTDTSVVPNLLGASPLSDRSSHH